MLGTGWLLHELQNHITSITGHGGSADQLCLDGFGALWGCVPFDNRSWLVRVLAILVGFLVVVWLLRRLARRVLRPVSTMTNTVRQLGPQNLTQRVWISGPRDELRRLADALNEMLDRVAVGLEGQRRFASNASHELRTPLAVQRTLVEVAIVTGRNDPELNRLAEQLLLVNERNERLIEGLLVLAESDRGLPGTVPVRLHTVVSTVLDSYGELAAEHEVTIDRDLVERIVPGDPVLLERLVCNLVHNGIKYNEPGGTVHVAVGRKPALAVHNTGVHVPAESVSALFEPFRRLTAERVHQRDGAGLGLSIVRSICSAHGGTVSARPGDRGGLRVEISLPVTGGP
jgi:signal transduction histidine kinase